jgi:hypothetical protein
MKKKPYKRKPGDFEVRILSDGRVVMVAPDEELIEIARMVERSDNDSQPTTETKDDAARESTKAKEDNTE